MENLDTLKERYSLLTEVERDLGSGRKSGRWVLFSCPFPGHAHGDANPSLAVTDDNGRYHCFTCGRSGDVITWLREYREMSWQAIKAITECNTLPTFRRAGDVCTQTNPTADGVVINGKLQICKMPKLHSRKPPPAPWQVRGMEFISTCEAALWSCAGEKALDYIRRRGLNDDTIRFWRLGYNPSDMWDPRSAWGMADDSKGRGVWLPCGVVIPCLITGDWSNQVMDLWYLKIRRADGKPKYQNVPGGRAALFGADNLYLSGNGAGIGLLLEGEFDTMLAWQELPEAGAATLGSASRRFDLAIWGRCLLPLRCVLAAYDTDRPGKEGAAALTHAALITPVTVPTLRAGDKDLSDYYQAGGDLWGWLRYNLERLGLAGCDNPKSMEAAKKHGK